MSKSEVIAMSWMGLCAIAIVVLCWLGIVRDYHAIPYWDSWNGLVEFVLLFQDGSFGERLELLFSQHNEHRFVLTRFLFLADYAFFNSSFVLLFAFNAVIPFLAVCVILKTAKTETRFVRSAIAAVSCCFLFLLLQRENFSWEFQSQFFLAYYIPLLGYYLVIRFWSDDMMRNAALVGGTALCSAFTMANGVLYAMPLAVLFLFKSSTRLIGFAAIAVQVLVLTTYLFLLLYQSTPHHGGVVQDVLPNLPRYIAYILTYIGAPFSDNPKMVRIYGVVFILLAVRFFWIAMAREKTIDIRNVLLLYIMFYVATVAVTGIGRVNFGVEQAFAERYMTPTLLAWLCLIVLGLLHIRSPRWYKSMYFGVLPLFALVGLDKQIEVYKDTGSHAFERNAARLALYLGVLDEPVITAVYPHVNKPVDVFAKSTTAGLNFTLPLAAWTSLGNTAVAEGACQGGIADIQVLPDGFSKVSGWIVNPAVTDQAQTPVAVAMGSSVGLGQRGQQIAETVHPDTKAGFVLYVRTEDISDGAVIHSSPDDPACVLSF
ncbi:MAG: hypothetical protein AAF214_00810 [Pseudomonadota bacterium]